MPRTRQKLRWVVPVVLAASLVAAGCGDDDDDSAGSGESAQDNSALLGPANPATGTPIKIGFVTNGAGTAVVQPEEPLIAQAAAKYVNEHLGGVAGHPVEVVVCEEDNDPALAQQCANQMINEGMPAVLVGGIGTGQIVAGALAGANIPYIGHLAASQGELAGPNAFILNSSIVGWVAGVIKNAKEKGLNKIATLAIGVPSVTEGFKAFSPLFQKEGLEFELVPVPPGTPDMSPQVGSALQGSPDAFWMVGDPTFCTSALNAIKTLSPGIPTYVIDQCIDESVAEAVPGGFDGTTGVTQINVSPDDPGFQLYNAVVDKYAPDLNYDRKLASAARGFAIVVGFARAMEGLTGDLTAQTVTDKMRATKDVALPLGGQITFSCDGTAVPRLTALCSTGVLTTELEEDGSPTEYKAYDAASLFQP